MREFTYCVGDFVSVRVSSDGLNIFDLNWNDSTCKNLGFRFFEIIAKLDHNRYIIDVSVMVTDNFDLDYDTCIRHNIDQKLVGNYGYLIHHTSIGNRKYPDYYKNPLCCVLCKDSYPYAEANFGNKLICWSCRNDPRNQYKIEEYSKYQT